MENISVIIFLNGGVLILIPLVIIWVVSIE